MTSVPSYAHGTSTRPLVGDTVGRLLDRVARLHPRQDALVSLHQNIRWSYAELAEKVDDLAARLMRLGFQRGDRIAIWAQNCAEWVLLQFASAKVGAILVTVNPACGSEELSHVLAKTQCRGIVLSPTFRDIDHIQVVQELASDVRVVVRLGTERTPGMLNFAELTNRATDDDLRELAKIAMTLQSDDPVSIQFTSGTTGRPKGATLTHHGLVNNALFAGEAMGITSQDRFCIILPLYHCGAMVLGNLACVTHGATIVYPSESYDPGLALKAIESERCTAIGGVPTMFIGMLEHPNFARSDVSSLRTGNIGGAPCPMPLMKRLTTTMNLRDITIGYGMTETSPISFQTCATDTLEQRVSTVGRVHAHVEAKIVAPDGSIVPRGIEGEILVRGYSVMRGYWDDLSATTKAIDDAGWMHTGDIGVLDEDAYLRVVGRVNDMIIRGGENIYPREIEDFLFKHPCIEQVAVFGVPDNLYGEEICAWVKVRTGMPTNEEGVRGFCRGQIAAGKIPRYIRFVETFPMTVNGKIQRYLLRSLEVEATPQRGSAAAPVSTGAESTALNAAAPEGAPPLETRKASVDEDRERGRDRILGVLTEKLVEAVSLPAPLLSIDTPFAHYGVDSIRTMQLADAISRSLSIDVTATDLFDHGSLRRLADYLATKARESTRLTDRVGVSAAPQFARNLSSDPGSAAIEALSISGTDLASNSKARRVTFGERLDPAESSIAVVGMSGRFNRADSIHELWDVLRGGVDTIEEVSRWNVAECLPAPGGDGYCHAGGFLRAIDRFDPLFFGISALEATYMDPQQRLFLEEAWKSLEDAGYAGQAIEGSRCGVYVGYNGGNWDYSRLLGNDPPPHAFWGNSAAFIPARIAYCLNLHGPAIAIDTACSSSLVAIHLACESLRKRETDMALAGGVFVQVTPAFFRMCNTSGMLSPRGRCHAFDDRADGFVPGEAVSAIVLRRLSDAVAAGDRIYGVIRGSGVNQDGATNGITAPSALSQERLIRQVYDSCGIDPDHIQMVETHGTGTKLGDPIEFQALTKAFRTRTRRQSYCALGSVKTNLGHSAAAAGIASVVKVLLSLQHKQIPASLHFEHGNPLIDFAASPFFVNASTKEWLADAGLARCAAVSSFGLSGTNAHAVIEEAPETIRSSSTRPGHLIALSAHSSKQLREQVVRLLAHCERDRDLDCGNASYTLLLGRRHLRYRFARAVASRDELCAVLAAWLNEKDGRETAQPPPRDQAEDVALQLRGERCIQACLNALDPIAYLRCLATVGELFVQGSSLHFDALFEQGAYRRIGLPTYPFARERYWIDEAKSSEAIRQSAPQVLSSSANGLNMLLDRLVDGEIDVDSAVLQASEWLASRDIGPSDPRHSSE